MTDQFIIKTVNDETITQLITTDNYGQERTITVCPLCVGPMPSLKCPYCYHLVCEECMSAASVCKECLNGNCL